MSRAVPRRPEPPRPQSPCGKTVPDPPVPTLVPRRLPQRSATGQLPLLGVERDGPERALTPVDDMPRRAVARRAPGHERRQLAGRQRHDADLCVVQSAGPYGDQGRRPVGEHVRPAQVHAWIRAGRGGKRLCLTTRSRDAPHPSRASEVEQNRVVGGPTRACANRWNHAQRDRWATVERDLLQRSRREEPHPQAIGGKKGALAALRARNRRRLELVQAAPNAQTSARLSTVLPLACSGAI